MSKSDYILKVENLAIGYRSKDRETVIAENIDLCLDKGELVGLVGANGIGKSTLLRTLSRVQTRLNGEVFLNGKSIDIYHPLELAKELSLVLTEQIVSKNLTVLELVALGRQPYTNWIGRLTENDIKEVEHVINNLQLNNIKYRNCYELSDGQLQQVMIARALAQETSLIILDEPTTHLDLYHKAYIIKLLKDLTSTTNKTILFSSHEIDLSIQICDKIIVMTDNNVFFDTPCKLIEQGIFNTLFPVDLITFDQNSGSFRVNK